MKTYKNNMRIVNLILIIIFTIIPQLSYCLDSITNLSSKYSITTLNNPCPGYLNIMGGQGVWGSFALIDNYGTPLFDVPSVQELKIQKFMPNGQWLVNSSVRYKLHIYDSIPRLIDSIVLPQNFQIETHDFLLLKNGHYLLSINRDSIMDLSDIIDGGLEDAHVLGFKLVEVDKSGNIYWSWDCFNYLSINDVTVDIDLTQQVIDFTHVNSFVEDSNGAIIVSIRNFDEIIKINKQSGQIVWRLGGTGSRNNQFTFINDNNNGFVGFSHQHSIQLITNGNILLFDNGFLRNPQFSRAVEYRLNENTKTATKVWEYRKSPDIFQSSQGSVERLVNGNTLINWGGQFITEVKPNNTIALELVLPPYEYCYRAMKLPIKMQTLTRRVTSTGEYNFTNINQDTKIKLNLSTVNGIGSIFVSKHNYLPDSLTFKENNFSSILPYRWVINKDSINSFSGIIKINIDRLNNIVNPSKISIFKRNKETEGNFQQLNSSYNSTTKELSANYSDVGELVIVSHVLSTPSLFFPRIDMFGVATNGYLAWRKLLGASNYRVQISQDSNFANIVIDTNTNSDTIFAYFNLANNSRYFWRIRGYNFKDTSQWSSIRKFTTLLEIPNVLSPIDNFVGFKLSDTLKWSSVAQDVKYRVQISNDENFISNLKDVNEISSNYYPLVVNSYNAIYYWRVKAYRDTDSSDWTTTSKFTTIINQPNLLSPVNDSINLPSNVILYWSDVNGASKYSLQLANDENFNDDSIIDSYFNISLNNFQLSELDYNTKYYWRVRAVRNTDSSNFSDHSCFTTLMAPLELNLPVDDSSGIFQEVNLVWQKLENINNYHLQVATDDNFDNVLYDIKSLNENNYTISSLPNNQRYYWRVRYISGTKSSEWSEVRSFSTGYLNALTVPELNNPKNRSINVAVQGTLIWLSVESAEYYSVQISKDSKFKNIVEENNSIRITSYDFKKLEFDSRYFWRVKAYNDIDSSDWSNIWEFTTNAGSSLAQINLIAPEFDALQIELNGELSWSKFDEANHYHLQLSLDSQFNHLIYDIDTVTITKFNFTNLQKNQTYYWRVKALSKLDSGLWSEIWEFSTVTDIKLFPPKLLGPSNHNYGIPIQGQLSWDAVSEATSYKIRISKDPSFFPRILSVSWHKELELSYSNLEYNTLYYWRVAGQNDAANSNWSDTRSFYTELENPKLLTPINNSVEQPQKGTLSWSSIQGANLYSIKIGLDSSMQELLVIDTVANTTFEYNMDLDQILYWQVKALNDSNFSSWSEIFTFKTITTSEVEVFEKIDLPVTIYPNPFSNVINLNFKYNLNSNIEIKLYNMLGLLQFKRCLSESDLNGQDISIDFMEIPDGLYLMSVSNGEFQITEFIIKLTK